MLCLIRLCREETHKDSKTHYRFDTGITLDEGLSPIDEKDIKGAFLFMEKALFCTVPILGAPLTGARTSGRPLGPRFIAPCCGP